MTRVDFNIKGLDGVLEMLKELPKEVVSKRGGVVRKSLRKGAVIIQKEAKLNVQKIINEPNKDGRPTQSTGALIKAISIARGKFLGGTKGERYLVWIPKDKKKYANTRDNVRKQRVGKTYMAESAQFYGRFLEYGTSKMRKHPWLRPAFDSKKQEATNTVNNSLVSEIEKITQKLLKKV
jgi:HK97 gp10 family phage protein